MEGACAFLSKKGDAAVSSAQVDVALDLPRIRQLSVGMRAYAEALAERLPRLAPDLSFAILPRTSAVSLAEQIGLPRALRRVRPRLVHFLSVYAPLLGPRPYVITIHDLIHLRFPEFFKRTVGPYYATVVRAVCAGAARVITDDERTIDDLGRFLGVPARKVTVVPLGIDDLFFDDAIPCASSRPYFFYAGNHRAHKDLATLYAAWEQLDPTLEVDLVLTGPDDLQSGVRRPERTHGTMRFLGEVEPSRLASLYAGAVALVHPALCEGFGLPMAEAAAVGAAVIACDDAIPSGLRPYAQVFPARDVGALKELMTRAMAAPPSRADARHYARTLTWDRCAQATAEVYRAVLREHPPQ
jgi:glycosyltransferase involved in cell wall biosynthesis